MKNGCRLSIVILCWNSSKYIEGCLKAIFASRPDFEMEVIVADNASKDNTVELVRHFPEVVLIETGANLGFSKGNNTAFHSAKGEYVLILNPDTELHLGALAQLVFFADLHPEAGAFGARTVWPDGRYQHCNRPFPTPTRLWVSMLYVHFMGRFFNSCMADTYSGWKGGYVKEVDWVSGSCLLIRGNLLQKLNGFDEKFFYHFEDVDLCRRVWNEGYTILYSPKASLTHIGNPAGELPPALEIEKLKNRIRYFHKHFGLNGARQCRIASRVGALIRIYSYSLMPWAKSRKKMIRKYKAINKYCKTADIQVLL